MAIASKKIFVSGRVQGVFFRESTRRMASQLKLTGGVRNLHDGRVEVQVCGDEEKVESLIKWLKIGPKFAKVSTIEVMGIEVSALTTERTAGGDVSNFEIWSSR